MMGVWEERAGTGLVEVDHLDGVRDACLLVAETAWSKGGSETVILSVSKVLSITDAFVVTSASNARMVRTIAEEVEKRLKFGMSLRPAFIEGLDDATWVLMDYGDFVVHIFLDETRDFYQFDRLWADAERWAWSPPRERALASRAN